MTKAKIFLVSLCVFAVLGAALAFNAKAGTIAFCYNLDEPVIPGTPSISWCPDIKINARIDGSASSVYGTSSYRNIANGVLLPVVEEADCAKIVDCYSLRIQCD